MNYVMRDVMVDLETMGSGPNAAIVAIGAVAFNPGKGLMGSRFYRVIDLESAVLMGGQIDPATVMWWLKQSDEARSALVKSGSTMNMAVVLREFTNWMAAAADNADRVRVWGNGASFDNVILASAYRMAGLSQPWKYWNDRCYRTVKAQYPNIQMVRQGVHHNALDDAVSQASHLIEMMRGEG